MPSPSYMSTYCKKVTIYILFLCRIVKLTFQTDTAEVLPRVVYDRVRKRKNYLEIPAFLQIERGKSRAGKFKTSNENINKNIFVFI